jgi:hypothetical protein
MDKYTGIEIIKMLETNKGLIKLSTQWVKLICNLSLIQIRKVSIRYFSLKNSNDLALFSNVEYLALNEVIIDANCHIDFMDLMRGRKRPLRGLKLTFYHEGDLPDIKPLLVHEMAKLEILSLRWSSNENYGPILDNIRPGIRKIKIGDIDNNQLGKLAGLGLTNLQINGRYLFGHALSALVGIEKIRIWNARSLSDDDLRYFDQAHSIVIEGPIVYQIGPLGTSKGPRRSKLMAIILQLSLLIIVVLGLL